MKPNVLINNCGNYQTLDISDTMFTKRRIFMTDSFTPKKCGELIEQLMFLENESHDEITLYISSNGGEVTSGLSLYDYIRMMKSPLKTVCIGTAASMGAILFLAGEKRLMLPHSKIMIHDPTCAFGLNRVTPLEAQDKTNDLMKVRKEICSIIADRTGRPLRQIYRRTRKDTFFTASEAIKFGIATEIMEQLQ